MQNEGNKDFLTSSHLSGNMIPQCLSLSTPQVDSLEMPTGTSVYPTTVHNYFDNIQVKYGEAGMQTQVFLTLKMRGFLWCHSARVLCVLLHTGLPWGQSSSSFNYLKPSPKGPYFFRQSYSSMYNENRVFKMKKVLENLVSMVITHLPLGLQYFQ